MKRVAVIFFFAMVSCSLAGPVQHIKNMLKARRALKVATSGGTTGRLYPVFDSAMMSASNVPAPIVISQSSFDSGGYEGWRAFERTAARWQGAAGAYPFWVKYDCGSGNSNTLSTISIVGFGAGYGIKTLELYASMDDSSYDLLGTWAIPDSAAWLIVTNATMTYGRYFRLNATNGYYSVPLVVEFTLSSADWESPAMTATNVPSSYVVSSDSDDAGGFLNWYAFDKNYASGRQWNSAANTNQHWLKLDLNTNTIINGFLLSSHPNYGPSNFTFSASLDDSDYTILQIGTAQKTTVQGETQSFTNGNTTAYRYYKFTSLDQYADRVAITELLLKHYK